ncbi:MAG: DNA polymerase/3'-5' exonuclease PolX [Actinobacteria bacterium]|nr:DNA polymerase/3'-5' exonuclease PolX [Actinomycetota bacterium]
MRANEEVARLLAEYADLLSIAGQDRFRIRAYENAARAIRGCPSDVSGLDVKALTAIPNVGKAIAEKVCEWARTGTITKLEELRAQVGPGVRDLLEVGGLGPKRAALVHKELGVSSVAELRAAAEAGALRRLTGFGKTIEEKILRTLDQLGDKAGGDGRVHIGIALSLAGAVLDELRQLPEVGDIEYAGSLRRMRETIGDVDVLVASTNPRPVMNRFTTMAMVRDVLAHGDTKSSITTGEGVQVDLRVVEPDAWGAALIYFTGSKAHNVAVRERAVQRGLKLSEYGLFEVDTGTRVASRTEEEVYAALELQWIPPTLREDRGEVEAASKHDLPDVVSVADIKGDLHGHTNLTDGVASLDDMVAAAAARGYRYYAVTDHAPLLSMQRMTPEKAVSQRTALRRVQERVGRRITLLHGSELNIQRDGSVDWDERFLSGFDVLVASIHSHFDLDRDTQTARMIRAMEHPCVNVIGHPSARRQGKRPAIDFDVEEVCRAAARTGTALEVNAQPERLDLPDELVRAARGYGARFVISTDAHSVPELDNMPLGVGTAQRGWATAADVVNTLPLRELRKFLKKGRTTAASR